MGNCSSCSTLRSQSFSDLEEMQATRNQLLREYMVLKPALNTVVHHHSPSPGKTADFRRHLEASATLGNGGLRNAMRLPWGVGRNEWIAAQTVELFKELIFMVSVLDGDEHSEGTCNPKTCPHMSLGKHISFEWADETSTKTKRMPAIEYMKTLVEYTHELLANSDVLPRDGGAFKTHFLTVMKTLHKRFFRCYAHVYIHHFDEVRANDCERHLNYSFKHWLFFAREFELVSEAELAPLMELIRKFEEQADRDEQESGILEQQPKLPAYERSS